MYANSYIEKANMPTLDLKMVEDIARAQAKDDEGFLVDSFIAICKFLDDNPDRLSLAATKREKAEGFKPSVYERSTLEKLAKKHFSGYRKSDVPTHPSTVPDPAVSNVLSSTFGYTKEKTEEIKLQHQQSMGAENSVGGLLERYIDSKLRDGHWYWCCGDFVRAIDFIHDDDGTWCAYQIKNRDNSENSSSSAIRNGTEIKKWFRSFSKNTAKSRELNYVNWSNLPKPLQGKGLSEEGFLAFIDGYIRENK